MRKAVIPTKENLIVSDITERYKNYSIDDLREVIRAVDKEKHPDLLDKAKTELENKIKEKTSTGNFKYIDGTELFLDSYIDENLSKITFNDDSILINSKIIKSYFYVMIFSFISLMLIFITIISKGNYYFLVAYIIIFGGYTWWRILDEIYQYSRSTIINFKLKTVHIKIGKSNNSFFKILFNQLHGDYSFDEIKGFSWDGTRNILYEPTSWIFVIKIILADGISAPICFTSTKHFAEKFTFYLDNLFNKNQQ